LPFPDYSDFPWSRYPNRIVPLITGRGCGWGACTFCSDVTSTVGRSFRSRSAANVLAEIAEQSKRYATRLFAFTDLKMNSNLDVWDALLERFAHCAPGAQWIGAVHVGTRQPNGLGPEELKAARAAGMVRLTTGLESGSQRVLDRMARARTSASPP
jgi:anaerobic magnesium-protoporphyrin IX monomethyl ester cyclase